MMIGGFLRVANKKKVWGIPWELQVTIQNGLIFMSSEVPPKMDVIPLFQMFQW
jgi:hypothetical protein